MKRNVYLITFLIVALILAGCASSTQEEPVEPAQEEAVEEVQEAAVEEVEEAEEVVEEVLALPGEGITVHQAQPTWDTEWFQAQLLKGLLEELGYTVEEPVVLDNAAFFLSAARGDIDFWASGWFPLHNTFMEDEKVAGKAVIIGNMAPNGGLMGYLIDKKTADEYGITNLGDLADPEIAALFDGDGDGMADLMGCDPGWGCELIINHHLEAYGLQDTVMHVQGSYSALLADTYARQQRGEPVLFFTWTPNWTVGLMVPGEDVVWIETPFYTAPEDQTSPDSVGTATGLVGCTNDPCQMGVAPAHIQVVANLEFLEANPAAASIFEQVQFDLADIFAQNALMFNGEDSVEDVKRHADEWIAANRDLVDEWIANAMVATEYEYVAPVVEEEAVEEVLALPGEGITVHQAQPTWDTEWFQAQLLKGLLEELGYTVEEPVVLDNAAFFLSAARGDIDFWASGWFPLHNTFMEDEKVAGKAVIVGNMAPNGGLMGYLIDKKTADEYGITNLGDLADPEIAALFDGDGDGMADLMGCDPGWGCELIINHHLEAYELQDTVMHVQGSYSALLADTYARQQRGEPVLFFTWTPNWTVGLMVPGEDVVWIETPFYTAPDDQTSPDSTGMATGLEGCTNDPCQMGVAPAHIQIVANLEFLEANPAANALFEQVQFDLADIFAQNALMFNGEDSVEDVKRHADEWIEANREVVDEWIANSIAAAK